MPLKGKGPEKKVQQVTLSKFFSASSSKKSTPTNTKVTTDAGDDFEIADPKPKTSKKRSKIPDENDSAPKDKKLCTNATSKSKKAEVCHENQLTGKEGNPKLRDFEYDELDKSSDVNEVVLKSRNCTTIDFDTMESKGSEKEPDDADTSGDPPNKANEETDKKRPSTSNTGPKKPSKSGVKYTPLEQQFVEIKSKHPGTVLFVECGYKYRFFGEDAEIAAKVLKIYCHLDHNFMTASIPVHRLFVHVRRLVAANYKVGVVKQTETAHLKAAGENKSGPFTRKLTSLYTKSTMIGEDVERASENDGGGGCTNLKANNYLMSIYEQPGAPSGKAKHIAIVSVDPATGDIIFDDFEDTVTFSELETRIAHIKPVEVVISDEMSQSLEKMISFTASLSSTDDDRMRVETIEEREFLYSQAFAAVSEFYTEDPEGLQQIVNYAKPVVSCVAGLLHYLKDFNLHNVLSLANNFKKFMLRSKYMNLNSQTLRNLEIFTNSCDGSEKGSFFAVLNHTCTRFGSRLLRSWLAHPLLDADAINERLDAIDEIRQSDTRGIKRLRDVLKKMPDVERGLCSVFHKKCSPLEFCNVTRSLEQASKEIVELGKNTSDSSSSLIKFLLNEIPDLLSDMKTYSSAIDEKAARENDKPSLFRDDTQFPNVVERKEAISKVLSEITDHRKEVRLKLKQPGLNYVTVQQIEFLVEVRNTQLKSVPSGWTQISSTKQVSRFHTPVIVKLYKKLNELREQLIMDITEAWQAFLEQFSSHHVHYQRAVKDLATLDCLISLAEIASQDTFCRPIFDPTCAHVNIQQGRHPIITALRGDQEQYVPNDTDLTADGVRVMVISGPNMGGKSSYIRQVALISIMAQMGSYVPAVSANLGLLDGIYTRMGASDEIFRGQSTFMVELQEASDIISQATDKSLIILDELGRGTSTHDGVAIAHATLHHFISQTQSLVLFVTHFPMMAEFHDLFPHSVKNYHMSFLLNDEADGDSENADVITFLYQLTEGAASKSYGLNVARLAEISSNIIQTATKKSKELEENTIRRINNKEDFAHMWNAANGDTTMLLDAIKKI